MREAKDLALRARVLAGALARTVTITREIAPWIPLGTWTETGRFRGSVHFWARPRTEDLPAGPDFFGFSSDEDLDALLSDGGLDDRTVETIAFSHRFASADQLWDGLLGGTVRISALIMGQPQETRRRIRETFDRLVADYEQENVLELPLSVKLAAGRKPG